MGYGWHKFGDVDYLGMGVFLYDTLLSERRREILRPCLSTGGQLVCVAKELVFC